MNKIIELEDKIIEIVRKDNGAIVHFTYEKDGDNWKVTSFTYKANSGTSFILRVVEGTSKENALSEILGFLKDSKIGVNSFTVNWCRKGGNQQISYFHCKDVIEVCDKFFTGKDKSDYIIYTIKLNPIS